MMERKRVDEIICNFLINANQLAYIEEAHSTLMVLENLNDLLRYFIRDVQMVTLYDELEILKKYITIEKMRHGDRFSVYLNNGNENRAYYINHLSVIDFFDTVLYKALERFEHFIKFTLQIHTDDVRRLKIILDTNDSKEIFTWTL